MLQSTLRQQFYQKGLGEVSENGHESEGSQFELTEQWRISVDKAR
jgi:hypothetical protein